MRLLPLLPLISRCWLGRLLVHSFIAEHVVAVVGAFITGRFIGFAMLDSVAVTCLHALAAVERFFHELRFATYQDPTA